MKTPSIKDILSLLTIPMMGNNRARKLLSVFPDVDAVLQAPVKRLVGIEGIDLRMARHIKAGVDTVVVDEQLLRMRQTNVECLTIWDPAYPELLKRTADAPVLLFYKDKLPLKWPPCIGVVGTRTPTEYGKQTTERLVCNLVDCGIAIVSGLARGIDTVAHAATIRRGGLTFAVQGCGIDTVYPRENTLLAENIQQSGAVFSEYFLGTKPDAINFPKRNRIISGLSLGTLVIEAGARSGALITAHFAADQNREVFAVPGNINSANSAGPNKLIQTGAKLVMDIRDILDELQLDVVSTPTIRQPTGISAEDNTILNALVSEPRHIDQLVLALDSSPPTLLARLLQLELKGLVKQLPGKMFLRT